MITNRKVKQLKENRISSYQLLLWKEMKIHIQKMTYTRKHSVLLTETKIIQGGNYGAI